MISTLSNSLSTPYLRIGKDDMKNGQDLSSYIVVRFKEGEVFSTVKLLKNHNSRKLLTTSIVHKSKWKQAAIVISHLSIVHFVQLQLPFSRSSVCPFRYRSRCQCHRLPPVAAGPRFCGGILIRRPAPVELFPSLEVFVGFKIEELFSSANMEGMFRMFQLDSSVVALPHLTHTDIIRHLQQREASQLTALLKEMKEGLDTVTNKVQALTAKVKSNQLPTSDGISYLDAKYLLLLNYCSSLVYYLLRKAKGFSIEGHPVVRSLVEIRLFLEKTCLQEWDLVLSILRRLLLTQIRPIDKKLEYQIQKLTKVSVVSKENAFMDEKDSATPQDVDDRLKYRPNPDMLVSKTEGTAEDGDGIYRPPKFAPTSMEEDKKSRKERNSMRKDLQTLRQARQSDYMRELMDDMAGKPEEIKESAGLENREVARYVARMEERDRREEELFTRAPLTKMEKKREKYLKKSRYGMGGVTDSFYEEVKSLPLEGADDEQPTDFGSGSGRMRKHKKRKALKTMSYQDDGKYFGTKLYVNVKIPISLGEIYYTLKSVVFYNNFLFLKKDQSLKSCWYHFQSCELTQKFEAAFFLFVLRKSTSLSRSRSFLSPFPNNPFISIALSLNNFPPPDPSAMADLTDSETDSRVNDPSLSFLSISIPTISFSNILAFNP
uniref:Neuroguidin n=1 Tax=Cucumis melo TaxID=3656 RepID=A0A9I9CH44_CUCME